MTSSQRENDIRTTYKIGGQIGEGGQAHVKKAMHRISKEKFAVKIYNKHRIDQITYDNALREIHFLRRLESKYTLRLIECFENDHFLSIVTELMDTSLEDYVMDNGILSNEQAKLVFTCLCDAIEHCHQNNIIHRDIKSSNVLLKLDENNKIVDCRLSDFGLAC